jgi:AraC-like DNA-binding protein
VSKSARMQNIELRRGRPLEDLIREQVEQGRTEEEIADDLGVSYWTFRSWLRVLGAQRHSTVRFSNEDGHARR